MSHLISAPQSQTQTVVAPPGRGAGPADACGPTCTASNNSSSAHSRLVFAYAAAHSLFWLVVANVIGVLLAAMLVLPRINDLLGPWTYGRWMPVHMNLQLYGWCSLPLVAFLFKIYSADRPPFARWASPVLWVWTLALAVGSCTWLDGRLSGKLFLDWTGYSRVLFPLALLTLWCFLTASFITSLRGPRDSAQTRISAGGGRLAKALGLLLLCAIPPLIYIASNPALYPPINPDTGGPTGASQLESTLVIIAILLLLPLGLNTRSTPRSKVIPAAWFVFAAEAILCLFLGRADISHHRPTQWISLGSLLVWIPLTPAYYANFPWHPSTRRWRLAFLCWWSVLVPTGWMLFLPGVLDHFKFTDGLVGHSLLAMAGFVSSLLIFVMVQIMGDDGWIFNGPRAFYTWHASVFAYVLLMFFSGWLEGSHPSFAIVPGPLRNVLYTLRLLLGVLILLASLDWFLDSFKLFAEIKPSMMPLGGVEPQEQLQ